MYFFSEDNWFSRIAKPVLKIFTFLDEIRVFKNSCARIHKRTASLPMRLWISALKFSKKKSNSNLLNALGVDFGSVERSPSGDFAQLGGGHRCKSRAEWANRRACRSDDVNVLQNLIVKKPTSKLDPPEKCHIERKKHVFFFSRYKIHYFLWVEFGEVW